MEGGLATVYSFVDLAILRVGLAPVPGEAGATPKDGHCSTFKTEDSEMAEVHPRHFRLQISDLKTWANRFSICDHKSKICNWLVTLHRLPRARTLVRDCRAGLAGDEVREEVSDHSEQRQAGNAIGGENPGAAAFVLCGGGLGLRSWNRRDDRGPIFHAKNLQRKNRGARTLCVTPAPLHGEARLSAGDFTPVLGQRRGKC